MTNEKAIYLLNNLRAFAEEDDDPAIDMAIKALQGDMYCPSCGVRLVPENEYVEPKPYEGESEEV